MTSLLPCLFSALLCFLCCTWLCSVHAQVGSWTRVTPAQGSCPRRFGHSAADLGDEVIVVGGYNSSSDGTVPLNDVWQYQFSAKSWVLLFAATEDSSAPKGRTGFTLIALEKTRSVLMFGGLFRALGSEEISVFNDLWMFSIQNASWTQLIANNPQGSSAVLQPSPRFMYAATDNADGFTLFGGAVLPSSRFRSASGLAPLLYNDVWHYSYTGNVWKQLMQNATKPHAPQARFGAASPPMPRDAPLIIAGGALNEKTAFKPTLDVWGFEESGDYWLRLDNMFGGTAPCPRVNSALVQRRDDFLFFGGGELFLWNVTGKPGLLLRRTGKPCSNTFYDGLYNDVWSFSVSNLPGSWTQLQNNEIDSSVPSPRQFFASFFHDKTNGFFVIGGLQATGHGPTYNATNDMWQFSPKSE